MLVELIVRYGYVIVILGTLLEGETIVVIAGYLAHGGRLALSGVILCAFAGSLLGDQLAYVLGRGYAPRVLRRRPAWGAKIERIRPLLERHAVLVMLGFRFLYGVRTVTPFTIGLIGVSPRTFIPLNAIGALAWAAAIASLGYVFGHAIELVLERARRYEEWVVLAMAVAAVIAWLARRRRNAPPAQGH